MHAEGGRAVEDLKSLLMAIVQIDFFSTGSVITVLYIERTIAIYGCHQYAKSETLF
jgi:hypothetical protein